MDGEPIGLLGKMARRLLGVPTLTRSKSSTGPRPMSSTPVEEAPELKILKKQSIEWEAAFKSESNPSSAIDAVEELFGEITASDARLEYFLTKVLSRGIWFLLSRSSYANRGVVERITDFLKRATQYCSQFVGTPYVEECFKYLFSVDPKLKFYIVFKKDPEMYDPEDEDKFQLEMTNQEWDVSDHMLANVNVFLTCQGPERVLHRIKDTKNKINLQMLTDFVFLFERFYDLLHVDRTEKYVIDLWDLTSNFVLTMTAVELKNEEKRHLVDIVTQLTKMLNRVYPPKFYDNKAKLMTEDFHIKVALQWLRLPYIQKRVQGLTDLNDFCQSLLKPPMKSSERRAITLTQMTELLQEEKIVEYLFTGESSHPELTRRAGPILKLLATRNCITKDHLDWLWAAAIGKHESIMHQMWELMGNLTVDLSVNAIEYLFSKIETVPPSAYDYQFIEFIRKVSENGIYQMSFYAHEEEDEQNKTFFGLELLWKNLQDDIPDPNQNSGHIFHAFSGLISMPSARQQRTYYIEECLHNLTKFYSVPKSLQVLEAILMTYTVSTQYDMGSDGSSAVLDWLVEQNVLSLLMSCLKQYAANATKVAQGAAADTDFNHHIFSGTDTYYNWIKTCLKFLNFILPTLNLTLKNGDVDILWDATISNALSIDVRDLGFNWLEMALANKHTIIPDSTTTYIFDAKITTLNFASLSVNGYTFFEYYFRMMNWQELKYETLHHDVLLSDLLGYDTLWKIVIEAQNEKVGEQSIALLNKLQSSVTDPSKIESIREAYISRFIASLKAAETAYYASAPQNQIYERQIIRCLDALTKFISLFEQNSGGKHGVSGKPNPLEFTITPFQQGIPKFTVSMTDKQTLAELRQKVGDHMKLLPQMVRLIGGGKELKPDFDQMTLRDLKPPTSLHVTRGQKAADVPSARVAQVASPVNTFLVPSQILSQDQYFEQIFQLLNLPSPLCQTVWELLMKLPTNSTMKDSLQQLKPDTDWSKILDPNNVFRLYYSLQIVDATLQVDTSDPTELATRDEWCQLFASVGGAAHLCHILLTADFFNSSCTKRLVCLGLLLENLNFFLLEKQDQPENKPPTYQLRKDRFVSFKLDAFKCIDALMDIAEGVAHLPLSQEVQEPRPAAQANEPEPPKENEVVAVKAMRQLGCILLADSTWFDYFVNHKRLASWSEVVIVTSPYSLVRSSVVESIFLVCKSSSGCSSAMYPHILSLLPLFKSSRAPLLASSSFQYFDLLGRLVVGQGQSAGDITPFIEDLIKMLQSQPIIEETSSSPEHQTLMGLMRVIRMLIDVFPAMKTTYGPLLFEQVFHKNLFDIPKIGHQGIFPPRCKTAISRREAFYLLLSLVVGHDDNMKALCSAALHLHAEQKGFESDWEYQPARYDKAGSGYVGLENQGATCYMNSLVQQLYMQPHFRHGVLNVNDKEEKKDESVLYQFQSIFVHLQESAMKYYNPIPFCRAYKVDGQPMRPDQQQDVDEFFNMLFDRLEGFLKGSPQATILTDLFGGEVVNQIISSECEHTVERLEPFLTLSLEVKSKFSLAQSLDLFIQGDILEGENKYHCSACSGKVTALKRCCINKLPRNLIVHLKRFDFDLELMRRSKINQYCEFPNKLNLEPYTKEGLQRREAKDAQDLPPLQLENYDYDLTGILVHSGTTESGHYYSFVKDRGTDRWYQFNDSHVTPFNPGMIPVECYGGTYNTTRFDPQLKTWVPSSAWRQNSAYMLFYEQSNPAKPLPPPPAHCVDLPKELYEEVWDANFKFLMDKNLFDIDYIAFLQKVLYCVSQDINKQTWKEETIYQACELGLMFYVQTLSHAFEKSTLNQCTELLKTLLKLHIPSTQKFVVQLTKNDWVSHLLTQCPNAAVSGEFCSLVAHAVSVLCNAPEGSLSPITITPVEESTKSKKDKDNLADPTQLYTIQESTNPIEHFIGFLLKASTTVSKRWRRFSHFWHLFEELANIGPTTRQILLNYGAVRGLAHIYLQHDSPWYNGKKSKKDKSDNDKLCLQNMKGILGAVSALVCGSIIPRKEGVTDVNPPWNTSGTFLPLPAEDKIILTDTILLRMIADRTNPEALVRIVQHFCWENKQNTRIVMDLLYDGINRDDNLKIPAYWPAFVALSTLDDSQHHSRVRYCLKKFVAVTTKNKKYPRVTSLSIYQLVEFVRRSSYAKQLFLEKYLDDLAQWIVNMEEDSKLRKEFEETRLASELLVLELVSEISGYIVSEKEPEYIPSSIVSPSALPHPPFLLEESAITPQTIATIKNIILTLIPLLSSHAKLCSLDKGPERESGHYKFVSLLRVMNWCTVNQEIADLFILESTNLLALYKVIDTSCAVNDLNKEQFVCLWNKLTDSPAVLESFVDEENLKETMILSYISLHPNNLQFNNIMLPHFYAVMAKFVINDSKFREYVVKQFNFTWALRYLFLESKDYPQVVPALQSMIRCCIETSQAFRVSWTQSLLQHGLPQRTTNWARIFEALNLLLSCPAQPPTAIRFCQSAGLDSLQSCFDRANWTNHDLDLLCESVYLATSWFNDEKLLSHQTNKALKKTTYPAVTGISNKISEMLHLITTPLQETGIKMLKCLLNLVISCSDETEPTTPTHVILTKLGNHFNALQKVEDIWRPKLIEFGCQVSEVHIQRSSTTEHFQTCTNILLLGGLSGLSCALPEGVLVNILKVLAMIYAKLPTSLTNEHTSPFFTSLVGHLPTLALDDPLKAFLKEVYSKFTTQETVVLVTNLL